MWFNAYYKTKVITAILFAAVLVLCPAHYAGAAQMSDYCVTPPYISSALQPNLLLMIDNSSSMYDLEYVDKGKFTGTCSITTTQTCSDAVDCPAGESCANTVFTRQPYYCYDDSYKSTNTYMGYFESGTLYAYDFANGYFKVSSGGFPGTCTKQITNPVNTLCISGTNLTNTSQPKTVTSFVALGNYLNWITTSKFDTQKKILTGGKYDPTTQTRIAESRGCVGRSYMKEALTADFVNFNKGTTSTTAPYKDLNDTNTSLGIVFGVRGPDPVNPTALFPGGQTYIDIYAGSDYSAARCQDAINVLTTSSSQNDRTTAVSNCLAIGNANDLVTKQKQVFGQGVHECYQYWMASPHAMQGGNYPNIVTNQCPDVYAGYASGKCSGSGAACTKWNSSDCPAGQTCEVGPRLIEEGNPALLCGFAFAGECITNATSWSKNNINWDDACITTAFNNFCGAYSAPQVVDPTSDVLATTNFDNLPAILGDMGVAGQLGAPATPSPLLQVRVKIASEPTGLVQEFGTKIRMGLMSFNYNGSPSECVETAGLLPVGSIPCPRKCSTDSTVSCTSKLDCPSPASATCDLTSLNVENKDGAIILHKIGVGHCSSSTATACTIDADCPSGESCKAEVGTHSAGLINDLNILKASTWTPFAEGFYEAIGYIAKMPDGSSNTNLRINTTDFPDNQNPSQMPCQKNNILLISDGMSTADLNTDVNTFASLYTAGTPSAPLNGPQTGSSCGAADLPYKGSKNLDNIAWAAKNRKISALTKNIAVTTAPSRPNESITTYAVFNGPPTGLAGECNSQTLLSNAAKNGGTSLYTAQTPTQLERAIKDAFESVAAKAATGTAASVLASGEGSGANLIQAVFYPKKQFINSIDLSHSTYDDVMWVGRLTNLWYFVDPQFAKSNIREDDGDKILNLKTDAGHKDYITQLFFDSTAEATKAHQWQDTGGNGVIGSSVGDVPFESLGNLWEAGLELWKRDSSDRTIYTQVTGTLIPFVATSGTASTLAPYLQAADAAEASNIISWVTGSDVSGYRSRTVKVDLNGNGNTLDTNVGGYNETVPRVWKLGDILNSTPKISSWLPLNTFNKTYADDKYGLQGADADLESPADPNHFITTHQYKDRGMVFTGANDGMLHAFKLGTLRLKWSGQGTTEKAKLDGAELGKEIWAFIPKNVLPYLKYTADPNYCHVYSVNLTPYVFDASIGGASDDPDTTTRTVGSWRTILIGGMRYGGACKNPTTACAGGGTDCVKTPADDVGYSSYFALDVTDQNHPLFMWEFTSPDLGFSTSGPSIVRINSQTGGMADKTKNGHWYVVIGSGPTGPINTSVHQFMGRSDQSLKIFVLDLKTGTLLNGNSPIDTGIQNAFAGSMLNSTFDTDLNYSDDVVYIPYVKKCTSTTDICTADEWTDGGVLRLFTKEDTEVSHWAASKVMDGVGPVTSAVAKLQNNNTHTLWLYFATGRYYYSQLSAKDDGDGKRQIFGLKEPAFRDLGGGTSGFDTSGSIPPVSFCTSPCANPADPTACTLPVQCGDLTNVTDVSHVPADPTVSSFKGWYINLDPSGSFTYPPASATLFASERNITDPLAISTGVVFFTTYKPYSDECALGGKSSLWAFKYDTGGAAGTLLKGKALVQVSTGSIEQVNLSDAFTNAGGRKSASMEGVPPTAQGLSILSTPPPVKRVVHIKER